MSLWAPVFHPWANNRRFAGPAAIVISLVAISILHYATSFHSIVWHEVFKRVYFVPIVIAAVTSGSKGGLPRRSSPRCSTCRTWRCAGMRGRSSRSNSTEMS